MKKHIKLKLFVLKNKKTVFEGNNGVGSFSSIKSSYLGKGSYIGNRCHLSNVKIGKFCSIGDEVSVICGTHPVHEFISSHPSFYSKRNFSGLSYSEEKLFEEFKYTNTGYLVNIENDVWIGTRVSIFQGVTIGTGSIIAAGAVVIRDVAPYEVVGGIPAKRIKMRFSVMQIEQLLKSEWWEWDDLVIKENLDSFVSPKKFFKNNNKV